MPHHHLPSFAFDLHPAHLEKLEKPPQAQKASFAACPSLSLGRTQAEPWMQNSSQENKMCLNAKVFLESCNGPCSVDARAGIRFPVLAMWDARAPVPCGKGLLFLMWCSCSLRVARERSTQGRSVSWPRVGQPGKLPQELL